MHDLSIRGCLLKQKIPVIPWSKLWKALLCLPYLILILSMKLQRMPRLTLNSLIKPNSFNIAQTNLLFSILFGNVTASNDQSSKSVASEARLRKVSGDKEIDFKGSFNVKLSRGLLGVFCKVGELIKAVLEVTFNFILLTDEIDSCGLLQAKFIG